MNQTNTKKMVGLIAAVTILAMLVSGCGSDDTQQTAQPTESPAQEAAQNTYLGTLKPVSEAKVIPSGKGEIISCPYEVGDTVSAGTLLYQIDDNGLSDTIATTKNAIAKSNIALSTAQENLDNLTVYAPASGILHNFTLKTGERVNASKIGDIVDESRLVAKVPFNEAQKAKIRTGNAATITSADMMASVSGTVSRIYDAKTASIGGSVLYNVEITISNPGGLSAGLSVDAAVETDSGTVSSPVAGVLEGAQSSSVVSRGSGNAANIFVQDGQYVQKGQRILTIDNSSLRAAYDRAVLDKSDLNIKLARLENDYADLFVYAPAGGTVTAKSKSIHDTISSSSESIMTIADVSAFTLTVNVSEQTMQALTEGAQVSVDLAGAQSSTVSGTIQKIVREGAINGSGKTYPVTIYIPNAGGIEPNTPASVTFGGGAQ